MLTGKLSQAVMSSDARHLSFDLDRLRDPSLSAATSG
jgi:hypothetical protein